MTSSPPLVSGHSGMRLRYSDRATHGDLSLGGGELALYYESVASLILPHLHGRPTALVLCPEGLGHDCFFQKHPEVDLPRLVKRVSVEERNEQGEYAVIDTRDALLSLVRVGIVEFHTWSSRVDWLERPDRLVFHLDPGPTVPWKKLVEAAFELRKRLMLAGLVSFVKTSGRTALHVVAPTARGPGWDMCLTIARRIVKTLEAERPAAYTTERATSSRQGKVFLDYLRNERASTSIAAYSVRAHPGATVSVPIGWDELEDPTLRSDTWNVKNLRARLAGLVRDPWADYPRVDQSVYGIDRRQRAS